MATPVSLDPFAGLQQGLQTQQQMLKNAFLPQSLQLEQQTLREQLATSQQQRQAAGIELQQAEQGNRLNQALMRGAIADMILQAPAGAREGLFAEAERLLGEPIPAAARTEEALRNAADIKKMLKTLDTGKKRGNPVEVVTAKDDKGNAFTVSTFGDGTVQYTSLDPNVPDQPQGPLSFVQKSTMMTNKERLDFETQKAAATAEAAALGKRRDAIRATMLDSRNAAQRSLSQVNELRDILGTFGQGKFAQAKRMAAAKFPLLRNADEESFLSLSNQVILGRKAELLGGGVLSDGDIALLQSVGPQLGNSVDGNMMILQLIEDAAQASIANSNRFDQWVADGNNPEDFRATLTNVLKPEDYAIPEPGAAAEQSAEQQQFAAPAPEPEPAAQPAARSAGSIRRRSRQRTREDQLIERFRQEQGIQ